MSRFFVFIVVLMLSVCSDNCWALTFDELENAIATEIQKAQKYPNIKVQISSHNDLMSKNNIVLDGVDFIVKDKFIAKVSLGDKQCESLPAQAGSFNYACKAD
jgi:DNA polymerase sigma